MPEPVRLAWAVHAAIAGTTLVLALIAAFALGIDDPRGFFTVEFFLAAVALFWSAYAAVATVLVWKWGRSVKRVLAIHALVLVVIPTIFGVGASIVA